MLIQPSDTLDQLFAKLSSELHRSAHDKHHPFRNVALASKDNDSLGLRYIVLRKVDENLNLFFFTDSRSPKVLQISYDPNVALLFFHPDEKVQIRVTGTAISHQQNDVTELHWQDVQDHSRKAYGPLVPPGELITDPDDAYNWPEIIGDGYFAVIEVNIQVLDVLQLDQHKHRRAVFKRQAGHWAQSWIAP